MTKKAAVSGALEIGNMGDGDPVVECLPAMFGDATSLSPPAKRERESEPAFVSVCVWACAYVAVCVRE